VRAGAALDAAAELAGTLEYEGVLAAAADQRIDVGHADRAVGDQVLVADRIGGGDGPGAIVVFADELVAGGAMEDDAFDVGEGGADPAAAGIAVEAVNRASAADGHRGCGGQGAQVDCVHAAGGGGIAVDRAVQATMGLEGEAVRAGASDQV